MNNNDNNKPKNRQTLESLTGIIGAVTSIIALLIALLTWLAPFTSIKSWGSIIAIGVGVVITFIVLILTYIAFIGTISGKKFTQLLRNFVAHKSSRKKQ